MTEAASAIGGGWTVTLETGIGKTGSIGGKE